MSISARVICDSIYAYENRFLSPRLTTFVLKYPRYIHSEVMTYRVFSRNAASSRAIPTQKLIDRIMNDPVVPVKWGKNRAGMQAVEVLDEKDQGLAEATWNGAQLDALDRAHILWGLSVHKEVVNRILEPFAHIEVVLTATDFDNFYTQRTDGDAQAEIQELSNKMLEAHNTSKPQLLKKGEWHLPFVGEEDYNDTEAYGFVPYLLPKISAARCARVSYLKHDGQTPSIKDDLELYERLMGGPIVHASPTEHQAQVPTHNWFPRSNLNEWHQFRHMIPNQNRTHFEGLKKYRYLEDLV